MYRYSYALEKFNRAIYTLSTDKDEIRKRLLLVFQGDLIMITPEHLPEQCRKDYVWIEKTITKFNEKYKGQKEYYTRADGRYDHLIPGTIESTLSRIRKSTGAKIAEKIYDIWCVLKSDSKK